MPAAWDRSTYNLEPVGHPVSRSRHEPSLGRDPGRSCAVIVSTPPERVAVRRAVSAHRDDNKSAEAQVRGVEGSLCIRAAMRTIASTLRSTSASVVAHDDTLMRMAVRPCHTVPPHQQVPVLLEAAIARSVFSGVAEGHQHLVQHHLVQNLESGRRSPSANRRARRQLPSISSARPASAQALQRRPHLDAPRPPRQLGNVLRRLPALALRAGRPPSSTSPRAGIRVANHKARPLS